RRLLRDFTSLSSDRIVGGWASPFAIDLLCDLAYGDSHGEPGPDSDQRPGQSSAQAASKDVADSRRDRQRAVWLLAHLLAQIPLDVDHRVLYGRDQGSRVISDLPPVFVE